MVRELGDGNMGVPYALCSAVYLNFPYWKLNFVGFFVFPTSERPALPARCG